MKKDDITRLLQQYLDAKKQGKEPYFDAEDIDELLDSLEESNDYTYFDEVLALGLKLHPYSTALKIKKCRQLAYEDEYEKALEGLKEIAETDNQDLDMLKLECYCSLNQYPKVVAAIEELKRNDCDYLEEIYEYISPILNDLEMNAESKNFLSRGLAAFPNNQIMKNELCYLLENEGEFEKAIDVCNELIDLNPFSYDYWFTLGRLYSLVENYEKAIDALDFAITCNDANEVEAKILKAYCLYMNESYEKAIDEYLDLDMSDDTIRRLSPLLAECYIKVDKFEEAYEILVDIVDDPEMDDGPSNYINYIRCCNETSRTEEANEGLERAVKTYPNNIRILSLYAIHLLEIGEKQKSVEIMQRLYNLQSESASNQEMTQECQQLLLSGQQSFSEGNTDQAIRDFEKAAELDPNIPLIHFFLAVSYLDQQDSDRFLMQMKHVSGDDMVDYFNEVGIFSSSITEIPTAEQYVEPLELAMNYINNKDHSN